MPRTTEQWPFGGLSTRRNIITTRMYVCVEVLPSETSGHSTPAPINWVLRHPHFDRLPEVENALTACPFRSANRTASYSGQKGPLLASGQGRQRRVSFACHPDVRSGGTGRLGGVSGFPHGGHRARRSVLPLSRRLWSGSHQALHQSQLIQTRLRRRAR